MECQLKILGRSPAIGVHTRVVAECGCGVIKTYLKYSLRSGNTVSCGCLRILVLNERSTTHGMSGTRIHKTWKSMKDRCTNPNNKYWNRYGGRGITVCDRWQKFENFYEDMGDKPEGKELDRIDNNKGYSPDNCRWVTRKENMNNQERSAKIEIGYIPLNITGLAELGAVSQRTMRRRWHQYGNAWDCLFSPANLSC